MDYINGNFFVILPHAVVTHMCLPDQERTTPATEAYLRMSVTLQMMAKEQNPDKCMCLKNKTLIDPFSKYKLLILGRKLILQLSIDTFYSWIACQLEVGTTLAFLLSRSDFKFETSF